MMKKILSILEWVGVMMVSLLGFISAPFVFPLVYPLRNTKLAKIRPFWFYFDDEDGVYGATYWRKEKLLTEGRFWTAYCWCALRNPAWNLQASLTPIKGKEVLVSSKGKLTQEGKEVSRFRVAVLMYCDDTGKWSGNVGEYLSKKYSIFGGIFIWFKIKNHLYWRASYAGRIFGILWLEIQIGVGYRFTFRLKLSNKKLFENHVQKIN